MSLCNTFRLSVVCCIIVLSRIDAPVVALPLQKAAIGFDTDLAQEESVQLELKRDLNVPDSVPLNETTTIKHANNDSFVTANPSMKLEHEILTESHTEEKLSEQTTNIPNVTLIPEQTTVEETGITTDTFALVTNSELQTVTTGSDLEDSTSAIVDKVTDIETTTSFIDIQTASEININDAETTELAQLESNEPNKTTTQDEMKINEKLTELEKSKNKIKVHKSRPMPKWKKYKIIERKRPSHSSEESAKGKRTDTQKEDILKAETQHVQVSMQDPAKSEILSTESSTLMSEGEEGVTLMVTEQSASTTVSLMTTISPTEAISQLSHESKRAGFLNYSGKSTTDGALETTTIDIPIDTTAIEVTTKADNSDLKTNEQRISVNESPLEDNKNIESQIVLNEDAIKEELLMEELINNNKENANRQRDEAVYKSDLTEIKNVNPGNSAETNSSSEISAKIKNNTLYTVSPNYKPMKKIEVVPPKQFVRDPDDNSWRNESLSSLGIVFKPKNSSKPFTQVLKNKTETEWNNLLEKDSKNELPDLRERLQKETQKRKSKRKKTDSFGNVVYFDYEENSSSAEHAGVTIDSRSSIATTYSPNRQSTNPESGSRQEPPQNTTKNASSTLTTVEGVHKHRFTTTIPKFLHEYYDSTDEDDSDYLNMAQIDLKKFTTSLRASTPFLASTIVAKQPDWLKQNRATYNAFPERKATVQYFPPRTTQKVNVNDYDDRFKFKMESFTTESVAPKHLPPVSEGPTTPLTVNTVSSTTDYTKNLLTQPQITTEAGLPLNTDGGFDRGTYVIKHYKDFVDEAAKHAEYDKNIGYIPFTEAPVEGVTKAHLIDYETEKPTAIDSEYDYESQFRKDVLQRFVDNFNQNSEQYRSDFPILFNSSIIHRGMHSNGDIASSRAFMRGSYSNDLFKPKFSGSRKACEPNCDKLTVELSPAYEVHYYMPDQEEKEEVQPVTLPYQYT